MKHFKTCDHCRGSGRVTAERYGYKIVAMRGKCMGYFCSLPDSYRGGKASGRRIIYQSVHTAARGCEDCMSASMGAES